MRLSIRCAVFSLFLFTGIVGAFPMVGIEVAHAAWFAQSSNNTLLVFDDGEAFVGSTTPCQFCPPTDTLNWTPAPCGNILASAGRTGEQILLLFQLSQVPGSMIAVTDRGHLLLGSDTQCWSTAMEGRSVFEARGTPREAIVGVGTDNVSQLYLLTASGNVLRVLFQGVQFQFVSSLGHFSGFLPTPALRSSWGELKSRYR